MNNFQGTIELIFGPMFSGKTSELMRKVKRYQIAGKKCLVINYKHDNRYDQKECIVNHDQNKMEAKKCDKIEQINNIFQNYDVIAIDEGQFFQDIVQYSELFANNGKIVLISALDATFQRKAFGEILNLVPMAEKVKKLTAICAFCFQKASFSQRIIDSNEIQLIGGQESYKPVCRNCFQTNEKRKIDQTSKLQKIQKSLLQNENKELTTNQENINLNCY